MLNRWLLAGGWLVFGSSALVGNPRISGDGQTAVIVPDRYSGEIRLPAERLTHEKLTVPLAAVELADYLGKSLGSRPAIFIESEAPISGTRIFVGPCLATTEQFPGIPRAEELVVRTEGDNLFLYGGDEGPGGMACRGTLFAVYDFLEREVGVRWLFPGEFGEVVPRHAALDLPAIDRREQPRVEKRKIRNQALTREDTYRPVLEKWGISVEAWKSAHPEAVYGAWYRRMRMGWRTDIDGGHAYDGWWERYGNEHPEWFALQPDGTRTQKPVRERLCKSNPGLWDEIARVKIAEFRKDPSLVTASICPNDGGPNKFCVCEGCRALDPAEAPKLSADSQIIDPATGKPFPEYPSLSDRVFTFYDEIAKRVGREMPDRGLVAYAYSVYRTPPVRVKTLSPNLVVGFVGLDRASIEDWSAIAPRLYIRPNDLGPAIDLGLPRNRAAWFADSVKFSVEHKAVGFDFDNGHGNWGGHGLDYYVLAKALWNPDLDVDATVADYCRAAYGPGAGAMGRYHARLAEISDAVYADPLLAVRSPYASRLRQYYSEANLDALAADLASAREAIGVTDAGANARVEFASAGLEYARLITSLLEGAGDRESPEHATRLAAVETFLKAKVLSGELAALHSHRYLRMALSYAEREVE